jgi:hypothetical protein
MPIRFDMSTVTDLMFLRPWKISMPLHRVKNMNRVLEYQCRTERKKEWRFRARYTHMVSETVGDL